MMTGAAARSLSLRALATMRKQTQEFAILEADIEIGSIKVVVGDDVTVWQLPAWHSPPTLTHWDQLLTAIRDQPLGDRWRLWVPFSLLKTAELPRIVSPVYEWLQAASRRVVEPPQIAMRYPVPEDAVALAHLIQVAGATTLLAQQASLGATIDTMLGAMSGGSGTILEACSWVAEEGRLISGATLVVAATPPLITLLVATSQLVGQELLLSVLDALHDFRYGHAQLLIQPSDPFLKVAQQVGFTLLETLVQIEHATEPLVG